MDQHKLNYERSTHPGINLRPLRIVMTVVKWMPLWVVPPLFGLWLLGVDDSFLGSLWGISCGLAYFGWAFLRAIYGKLERKYEVEDDHWRKRETSSAWGGVYVERVTREEEDG